MGVYIEGIEMPKGSDEHRLIIRANGQVIIDKKTYWEEAEAVPVPPHGDLIDRDALMNEFEKAQRTMQQHGREYSCSFLSSSQEISTEWYCVEDMLDNAATVIPASEEG